MNDQTGREAERRRQADDEAPAPRQWVGCALHSPCEPEPFDLAADVAQRSQSERLPFSWGGVRGVVIVGDPRNDAPV